MKTAGNLAEQLSEGRWDARRQRERTGGTRAPVLCSLHQPQNRLPGPISAPTLFFFFPLLTTAVRRCLAAHATPQVSLLLLNTSLLLFQQLNSLSLLQTEVSCSQNPSAGAKGSRGDALPSPGRRQQGCSVPLPEAKQPRGDETPDSRPLLQALP